MSALTAHLDDSAALLAGAQRQSSAEVAEVVQSSSVALANEQALRVQQNETSAALLASAELRLESALEECESLRQEAAGLREQVEKGADSKKTLAEYKLRAQKAVKQVRPITTAIIS